MRIFLSLNPDKGVLDSLKRLQDEIKEELGFTESFKIKWEQEDKLHITLFFLGEVEEEKLNNIRESLRFIRKDDIGEINFETDEFGAFPNLRHPRVLVCRVNNPDGKVFTLNARIAGILENYGYRQDKRFSPHITLGRVKKNHIPNLLNLKSKKLKRTFSEREFFIMKSVLSFKGSEYETLESVRLDKGD
ncbi:MAG: RNA 2',3'-cyclic phosphodiesterase [Ignavibacteria bacterium]|jgi:2'-5' RNA ligase|nr:RNA 2',3'-cyclic phosphodiesterase [Ignavibacteria bacterium]